MNSTEQSLRGVAIVSGAGRGLGRSHALTLARLGMQVVVNDVDAGPNGQSSTDATSSADAVVAEIVAAGGQAIANADSISTPEGAQAVVDAALAAFGRVDAVVNNAGFLRDRTIGRMTVDDWTAVVDVHLSGSFYLSKAAWDSLCSAGGSIVFTTSHSGLLGNEGQANYAAAKAGLIGLTQTLANEGKRSAVRVNAIAPLALTRLAETVPWVRDALATYEPGYVSSLVAYLVSAECRSTGGVFSAADGEYRRYELFESEAIHFPAPPSTAEMHAAFPQLFGGPMRAARFPIVHPKGHLSTTPA